MRQFQFIFKSGDNDVKVVVDTDILDSKTEKFTIMDIRDAAETEFVKFFPWWKGSVITRTEFKAWFEKFRAWFESAKEYGDPTGVIDLGASSNVKKLTITPTITSATSQTTASMNISVYNPDGIYLRTDSVSLTNATSKEVSILMDYTYKFTLPTGASWTSGSAPADIKCDGNETLAAGITVA